MSGDYTNGNPDSPVPSEQEFHDTLRQLQRLSILAAQTPEEFNAVADGLLKTGLASELPLPDMRAIEAAVLRKIAEQQDANEGPNHPPAIRMGSAFPGRGQRGNSGGGPVRGYALAAGDGTGAAQAPAPVLQPLAFMVVDASGHRYGLFRDGDWKIYAALPAAAVNTPHDLLIGEHRFALGPVKEGELAEVVGLILHTVQKAAHVGGGVPGRWEPRK